MTVVKPEVALAFALHSGPGTYALLLGSGVSRAAGVPTGWEVTLNLVAKLADAEEESAPDPEAWYRERYGRAPNYSEVVNALAPTRDERRALLQDYFEPDEEEREAGTKVPTAAHRAVARLCSTGRIGIVLTTNFDRLLERALEAEGVSPIVIDTPDAVEGAPPLQHAGVTVVKVNGDYLDTRIKNTPEELNEYDERFTILLGRIFDEYGLVVCGWSGTYDTALIDALKRAAGRRYMAYWVSRGSPSEAERSLTSFIRGTSIEAEGADEFFADLLEKVEALDTFGGEDPLSARIAEATTKRYLDEPERHVRLREFVSSMGREVRQKLFGEGAFPLDWGLDNTGRGSVDSTGLAEEMKKRVASYDMVCEAPVAAAAAGGYYSDGRQARAFAELVEAVASPPEPRTMVRFLPIWHKLRLYPALRLLYACGVSAAASENWPTLKALLRDTVASDINVRAPLIFKVYPWAVGGDEDANTLLEGATYYEPMAEWLYRTLREPLEGYLPLDFAYDSAFHTFEALMSLVYADLAKEMHPDNPYKRDWVPLGRFAPVHKKGYGDPSAYSRLRAQYERHGSYWAPIESGLLNQPIAAGGFDQKINTVQHNFEVIDAMIATAKYF